MIKTASVGPATTDPEAARKFAWRQAIDSNRDQWGRPKVMLPDGSKETGYRRASSYGAPLEDGTLLEKWGKRQVARGIARRGDLGLAVTRAEVGLSGDTEQVKEAKRELNDLCEQAMEAVESSAKATIGTGLHDVFELVDLGRDPGHVPELYQRDLAAYRKLTATVFRVLSSELFVVQDDHQVAGTLDRAVELLVPVVAPDGTVLEPGSVVIGDVKTSGSMDFAGCKFAVQCWAYATGHPYDPITKLRVPWAHLPPRTDWAVIFHVASGSGQARLHWVDLTEAAEAAEDARRAHEWRNRRGKQLITVGSVIEDFVLTCEYATSTFDLMTAYERAKAAGEWNDLMRQRFTRRRVELESVEAVAK